MTVLTPLPDELGGASVGALSIEGVDVADVPDLTDTILGRARMTCVAGMGSVVASSR